MMMMMMLSVVGDRLIKSLLNDEGAGEVVCLAENHIPKVDLGSLGSAEINWREA